MKQEPLYIIMPAYNEAENIVPVIDGWYSIVERYSANGLSRLVIVDDGSKDNTFEILQEAAKSRPLLQPISKQNSGHGATVLFGYRYALENGAAYIFQTDSDGQTLPEEFDEFWQLRDKYDMLIGWRRNREDGFSRVFVTKVLKFVIKCSFGVDVTDANTPFRLMKADTLRNYIELIPEDYNLSNVILSVIYAKKGVPTKYIPITFRPRQGGVNSINFKRIIGIGRKALIDFRTIKKTI